MSAVEAPAVRARRRRGGRMVLAVAAVAAAGAGAWAATGGGGARDGSGPVVSDRVPTSIAQVTRRDLVDRQDVEGTLGFADARTISASAEGTLTRLRPEGSIVRRGRSLFSIDARAVAYVLYGRVPMYRALRSGVSDGSDVRQLERNLVALGHDPHGAVHVDADWDAGTTAAVRRWERARGVAADGVVERGDVVFSDGPARVGGHRADVGEAARPGAPVTEVTARRRVVTARLEASRQALVRRGDRVLVTLPDGTEASGRVTRVGRVAREGQEGAEATVELRVALLGRRARRGGLDRAPVTVSVATPAATDVLAVPVTALVATTAGRYAVEVQDAGGTRRLVAVRTGAFADGQVEIAGRGLRAGTRVVVPR
jgi:peptidoglycan hydrolase-like protein with peptidoglycan-binding domain